MRVRDEQRVDPIVVLRRRRLLAATAALLRTVLGQRHRLDVTGVRQRDHHVLRRDQVFGVEFGRVVFDGRAAGVAELGAHGHQFLADDRRHTGRTRQNVQQVGDLSHHFLVLGNDLVLFQTGQALQTHLQNFLSLRLRQTVQTVGLHADCGVEPFRTVGGKAALRFRLGARQHLAHD